MARVQVLVIAVVCLCGSYAERTNQGPETRDRHPDVGLRVPELVLKYGYPLEIYPIQTEDGYVLTLHRIPHGKNNTAAPGKPVVFLMHGLLCSSADWVVMGPGQGLAYVLADRGYDVWMGNARGNTYSRRHISMDPDFSKKFWDFSWHDIGVKDLPAKIDFILAKTQQKSLYYIGHSQGTTAAFVLSSTLPQYNEKIRLTVALAPVAYMENIPNVAFKLIAQFHELAGWVASMLGADEFLPSTKFMQLIGQALCNDDSIVQGLCSNILFLIAGYNKAELNTTMIPVILSNTPAGAATKQFLHYAQGIKSGKFAQYDHGTVKNLIKYGNIMPPKYKTSQVTTPVVMLYGQNDLLTSEQDIYKLKEELKRPVLMWRVKDPNFSHLDFLWSINITTSLYPKIFEMLDRF